MYESQKILYIFFPGLGDSHTFCTIFYKKNVASVMGLFTITVDITVICKIHQYVLDDGTRQGFQLTNALKYWSCRSNILELTRESRVDMKGPLWTKTIIQGKHWTQWTRESRCSSQLVFNPVINEPRTNLTVGS